MLSAFGWSTEPIPQAVVDGAVAALGGMRCPSIPIVFDRANCVGRGGEREQAACVWRCDAATASAVAQLRRLLAVRLRRVDLRPKPSSNPHMTMLYDSRVVPEHSIDPLRWTATRFALILSHQGCTHHEWLGEWPLD